jgi:hypothetical protein
MLTSQPATDLEQGRIGSGLSLGELFLRYFELGGMSSALQLEAFLYHALEPTTHDHDVVAQALNERYASSVATIRFPTGRTNPSDDHPALRRSP